MIQEAPYKQRVAKLTPIVYQFKVELIGTDPTVWRRFEIHHAYSFQELHHILQTVMGWETMHTYEFKIGDATITDLEFVEMLKRHSAKPIFDASKMLLNDQFIKQGQHITYLYDFGDNWNHKIVLEQIGTVDRLPEIPICLEGEYACPPENSGGVVAYHELLEILDDPADFEHEEMCEWVGERFDPEFFSVADINNELYQLIDAWE